MAEIRVTKQQLEIIRDQARRIWQDINPTTAIDGKTLTQAEMTTISWIEAVSGFLGSPVKVYTDTPDSDPDTEY